MHSILQLIYFKKNIFSLVFLFLTRQTSVSGLTMSLHGYVPNKEKGQ